jgi:hypothetical protein
MDEQTVRTADKYQLKPTPEHERALAEVVVPCRRRYNTALGQRETWWGVGGVRAAYRPYPRAATGRMPRHPAGVSRIHRHP